MKKFNWPAEARAKVRGDDTAQGSRVVVVGRRASTVPKQLN